MNLDMAKEIIKDAKTDGEVMHQRVDQVIKERLREFDPEFLDGLEAWMTRTNRDLLMWYS